MFEQITKLKGRSWAELWSRGSQMLSALAERQGLLSDSRLPSDDEFYRLINNGLLTNSANSAETLLTNFRNTGVSKFFAAFDDRSATVNTFKTHFENSQQVLIEQADDYVAGRFHFLGNHDLDFGEPIDWHLEPVSGKRSPLLHWSRIDEVDAVESGDKKIVWELNRHQYFVTLGRAYWVTQDERYAKTFASHLSEWMDQNPPKLGLNWVSSLEVAFRAISWLWALQLFKNATQLTPELYTRTLKFLYLHGRHVETYLSTYSSPNTHLTGEALGLYYMGTLLPEFDASTQWREKGKKILVDELSRHVLDDGVYFERASYYHRYTTEFYTHFLILSERNADAIGNDVKKKLQSLLDHLMYLTRPDGTTPFVGDDDGGRLVALDQREINDFRPVLSTGASLFNRADYKFVAGEVAESTLWLLGTKGVGNFEGVASHPPESTSRAFPDGGYYVMRDGWTKDSNYLLLDCGPHGVLNCGHAHADALSFEMAAKGRAMLVDTGTFTYTGSREERDYFRNSSAHNTLTVDWQSSSVPDGPFSWKQIANSLKLAWKSDARFDFFSGTHDGYQRLRPSPVKHTRSVLFLKNDYWVMRDLVETSGAHCYDLYFHFAPGTDPHYGTSDNSIVSPADPATDKAGLEVYSFSDDGEWSNEEGWVSPCYGARTPSSVFRFSARGNGEREFFSFFVPQRTTDDSASIREIETKGGRAFEVRTSLFRDVLIGGNGTSFEVARMKSDFKWAWVRFGATEESLEELVLVDGRSFCLDGEELLTSESSVDYVVARRIGDSLRLEIDNRIREVKLPTADLIITAPVSNPASEV